jgi:hypothetical protein
MNLTIPGSVQPDKVWLNDSSTWEIFRLISTEPYILSRSVLVPVCVGNRYLRSAFSPHSLSASRLGRSTFRGVRTLSSWKRDGVASSASARPLLATCSWSSKEERAMVQEVINTNPAGSVTIFDSAGSMAEPGSQRPWAPSSVDLHRWKHSCLQQAGLATDTNNTRADLRGRGYG